jgi:hypothetical protein
VSPASARNHLSAPLPTTPISGRSSRLPRTSICFALRWESKNEATYHYSRIEPTSIWSQASVHTQMTHALVMRISPSLAYPSKHSSCWPLPLQQLHYHPSHIRWHPLP